MKRVNKRLKVGQLVLFRNYEVGEIHTEYKGGGRVGFWHRGITYDAPRWQVEPLTEREAKIHRASRVDFKAIEAEDLREIISSCISESVHKLLKKLAK